MKNRVIAGIDYSITSPAICIHTGNKFSIKNCKFLFLTKRKKLIDFKWSENNLSIEGKEHSNSLIDTERFAKIALEVTKFIVEYKTNEVALEGYSFGSHGKNFNIGENTGLLKYFLISLHKYNLSTYPPTTIKKFAVGKGNASKEIMVEGFIEETGLDILKIFDTTNLTRDPITDIVDAYWITKMHMSLTK